MALAKPTQITVPFSSNGVKNTIPETATGSNLASMQEGFPVITMTDVDQGGMPPQGQDMNGILFDVTTAIRYQQAGGLFPFDATFAQTVDGYPLGALLTAADGSCLYQNTVSGNVSDPENGGQGWSQILSSASIAGKQDKLTPVQMDAVNSGITSARVAIYDSYANGKQDALTFDNTPTNGSSNPVTSDGIYTALGTKQDTITFDATPQSGSTNPVQSGGVYDALAEKVNIDNAGNAEVTSTGSTTARTLANRFADVINVKDFGAKGDGVADDTSSFQAAVNYAVTKAIDNRQIGQTVVMDSETAVVVPSGKYIVSSLISSSDVVIRWILAPETKITGIDYLGGVVDYVGKKIIKRIPYGNYDKTNTLFVASGCPATTEAPLSGFQDYSGIVPYTQCDVAPLVAASYDRNTLVAKIENVTVSGNNLTGLSLTAAQQAQLRKGMRLYAEDSSSNRYVATVTAWTSSTISTGGWFTFGGTSTAVSLPSGSTVLINGKLSFFAHHNLVSLTDAGNTAQRVNVQENIYMNEDSTVSCAENGDYGGGYSVHLYDARSYGTTDYNRATVGYVARGNMWHAFSADKSQKTGFSVRNYSESDSGNIKEDGFIDHTGQGRAFAAIGSTGRMAFNVNAVNGNINLGDISTRENASISFHSSGNDSASFDSIIYSTTTAGGNTYLALQAGYGLYVSGSEFRPQSNNATNLGNSSFRWKEVFATTGTINTSDERLKSNVSDISDDVLDAWGDVNLIVFQFKDALEKKGDSARIHTGVIAQQVQQAFEAKGLDAFRYGLLCHDEPQPIYETRKKVIKEAQCNDDGEIVFPEEFILETVEVGMSDDIYSIRYEEALVLEAAYQRRRADRIESRLKAIEERMA